ncbi:MAG TPA: GNAT family N-acetyltransferase [Chitinophagaceae bacterium]|nr:GNAT family N-acetyltransferase [Chitinophagaceae bacterium]
MNHQIDKLTQPNLQHAAKALANAFMTDPLQQYVFPDEAERKERSLPHFSAVLQYGILFGEVYTTSDYGGAVVWLKPGETIVTPEKAELGGLAALPQTIGEAPFTRFINVLDYADQFHKQDMNDPHWYTMVLGVDPASQGKGYGNALLQTRLEEAKSNNIPVYLETAQPRNVSFYKHMGFDLIREVVEPVSGIKMWTFIKK